MARLKQSASKTNAPTGVSLLHTLRVRARPTTVRLMTMVICPEG